MKVGYDKAASLRVSYTAQL